MYLGQDTSEKHGKYGNHSPFPYPPQQFRAGSIVAEYLFRPDHGRHRFAEIMETHTAVHILPAAVLKYLSVGGSVTVPPVAEIQLIDHILRLASLKMEPARIGHDVDGRRIAQYI